MCTIRFIPILFCLAILACSQQESSPESGEELLLLTAAESGDLPTISRYTAAGAELNIRDACLWTPLMKAALNGHAEAVRQLITAGAEVNLLDKGGYSALMLAASNNHAEIVALLLQNGAKPDQQELTEGFTALIWAAKLGHTAAVNQLLSQGADKTLRDKGGKSALDWSREMGHGSITAALSQNTGQH